MVALGGLSSPGAGDIREKHGIAVPDDDEHLRALTEDGRVVLAITLGRPCSTWSTVLREDTNIHLDVTPTVNNEDKPRIFHLMRIPTWAAHSV